MTLKLCYMSK